MRLEGDDIGRDGAKRGSDPHESEIERIVTTVVDPVVRKILYKRMNFVLGDFMQSSLRPDAEDLYQSIMLKVAVFLKRMDSIHPHPGQIELKGYVAAIAHNVCNDHLREKYPERNRLRDRIREFLKRHRDFDRWAGANGAVCGFSSDRGNEESPLVSDLLNRLASESFSLGSRGLGELAALDLPELLAELFRSVRGPIGSDHLTHIIAVIHGIKDRPTQSIEELGEVNPLPSSRSNEGYDRVATRQILRKIWQALSGLPLNQRRVYLYTQADYEGQSLLHLMIREQAVALSEVLSGLNLTKDELISLLGRVPMEPGLAAIELGATNRVIAKWKYRAVSRVRAVIEEYINDTQ